MTIVWGFSFKEWWIAVAVPVAGFIAASFPGALISALVVVGCAKCRKRWMDGARGRDLLGLHRDGGER